MVYIDACDESYAEPLVLGKLDYKNIEGQGLGFQLNSKVTRQHQVRCHHQQHSLCVGHLCARVLVC